MQALDAVPRKGGSQAEAQQKERQEANKVWRAARCSRTAALTVTLRRRLTPLPGTAQGKSTAELLQQMYAEADEDGKAALSKAWEDGREKRESRKA